jgi:hypothetical protein
LLTEQGETPPKKGFPSAGELADIEQRFREHGVLALHGLDLPHELFESALGDSLAVFPSLTAAIRWLGAAINETADAATRMPNEQIKAARALKGKLRASKGAARVVLFARKDGPAWLDVDRADAELTLTGEHGRYRQTAGTNERRAHAIEMVLLHPFLLHRMKHRYLLEHLEELPTLLAEIATQTYDPSQIDHNGRVHPDNLAADIADKRPQNITVLYGNVAAQFAALYELAEAIVMDRPLALQAPQAKQDRVLVVDMDPAFWRKLAKATTEQGRQRFQVGEQLMGLRTQWVPQGTEHLVLLSQAQPRWWDLDAADLLLAWAREKGAVGHAVAGDVQPGSQLAVAFGKAMEAESSRLIPIFRRLTTGRDAVKKMEWYPTDHLEAELGDIREWIRAEYARAQAVVD